MIDFESDKNIYLIPPYIEDKERLKKGWQDQGLKGHVFICSSGTSSQGEIKTYALSKEAILKNADAVNHFLDASKSATWLASLPIFHVGGLSIFARSYLLGQNPLQTGQKWNDEDCLSPVNYFSVVPTQLYRMVKKGLRPPREHKGVFVGGDFLAKKLSDDARILGWKVIATYGMTEVCSQLASSFVTDSFDGFLDILHIHKFVDGGLESESLYTSLIVFKENELLVSNSGKPFELADKYDLSKDGNRVRPMGRADEFFKHKGKLFSRFQILGLLQGIFLSLNIYEDCQVLLEEDSEYGQLPIIKITKENLKSELENALSRSNYLKGLVIRVEVAKEISKSGIGKIKNF